MLLAWSMAVGYLLQLYFDFSGYSDMALGLARMFGFHIPANFNAPYRATSIVDFWRRWHITLSRFLRDYLYIPLGGNRRGRPRRYINLFITMLLGGLWHGAGWNFVIWGGLHGGYLIVNHVWTSSRAKAAVAGWVPTLPYAVASWVLTMSAVIVAWVFFRAESFEGAVLMLQAMSAMGQAGGSPVTPELVTNSGWIASALVCLFAIAALFPNSLEITRNYRPVISAFREISKPRRFAPRMMWRPTYQWGVCFLLIGAGGLIQIYRLNGLTDFIYFNF